MRGIVLNLAPKPVNTNVDAAIEGFPVTVRCLFDKFVPAERAVRVVEEKIQQITLSGREINICTVGTAKLTSHPVVRIFTKTEGVGTPVAGRLADARLGAAQHAAHASQKLTHAEGLDDIVVGTGFEPKDTVLDCAECRDDDDPDRQGGAKLTGQSDAVLARQTEVKKHQIDRGLGQDLMHFFPVRRRRNGEAAQVEIFGDGVPHFRFVVND